MAVSNASSVKSVWGSAVNSDGPGCQAVSLNDVMSEELARSLNAEEERAIDPLSSSSPAADGVNESTFDDTNVDEFTDCGSDHVLAKMLQMQFDKEHDACLAREAKKVNGTSKVSLNFDKFRRAPQDLSDSDSDDDYDDDADTKRHWDSFEESEKNSSGITIGKKTGLVKQGNTIISKHDPVMSGRRNACRVMEFQSNIETGDGGGFDMQLPNRVFNALKVHNKAQGKRLARLHEKKEKSTAESVMDQRSRLLLYKLANRGILDEINGTINTGKEAVVYHGIGQNPERQITTTEVAIKVFKTTLTEFKNRDSYTNDEMTKNPRKLIPIWAEKEACNLGKIRKAGIPCPDVVLQRKHVLIMTFIGSDAKAAPTLHEARLPLHSLTKAYNETVDIMKKLHTKCGLVHADLSEFNLLWHLNKVWVIDVGQSIFKDHPNAFVFLLRDCSNISTFFAKKGVENVLEPAELFEEVTGKSLPDTQIDRIELLSKIEVFEKNQELLAYNMSTKTDDFDDMFAMSCQQREQQRNEQSTGLSKSPGSSLSKSPPTKSGPKK